MLLNEVVLDTLIRKVKSKINSCHTHQLSVLSMDDEKKIIDVAASCATAILEGIDKYIDEHKNTTDLPVLELFDKAFNTALKENIHQTTSPVNVPVSKKEEEAATHQDSHAAFFGKQKTREADSDISDRRNKYQKTDHLQFPANDNAQMMQKSKR